MRPGSDPYGRLSEALLQPGALELDAHAIVETIIRRGSRGLTQAVTESRLPPGTNLLLLVDQFEELFRFRDKSAGSTAANDADAFVRLLLDATSTSAGEAATDAAVYVVLTMRSDFLGDCALFTGLPEAINDSQFLTPRLPREQYREAIEEPARLCGGKLDSELVTRLLNDEREDPGNPLQRGLQIPVRFRSEPADGGDGPPPPIPLAMEDRATAAMTAIVVLVDDKMLLDRKVLGSYLADLWNVCKDANAPRMLVPISVSSRAHMLHPDISEDQFIRLTDEQRESALCNRVTHELCRLALGRKRAPGESKAATARAPVTVLLSHSKQDEGKQIAEEFRDYIAANVQMKSFFDTADIPPGVPWKQTLDLASSNVGMLAHPDRYLCQPPLVPTGDPQRQTQRRPTAGHQRPQRG